MKSEPNTVGYDAQLLSQIIDDERAFTRKRLCELVDKDTSTISRYLCGEATIPLSVFRAVFELTGDLRILRLLTGTVPVVLLSESAQPAGGPTRQRVPPLEQCLPTTLKGAARAVESGQHLAEVMKDGKFDRADAPQAAEFKRDANSAIELLTLTIAAIEAHERRLQA